MISIKPVVVGSFVLGAIVLGAGIILVLGNGHLLAKNLRVVVVFKDSIAGLEVGAPVTFRGMRIGRVQGMQLHLDVKHHDSWIPVYLTVDLGRISWANGTVGGKAADLQAAVDAGLRAQLASQSLVSGQLSVDLDYHPDRPALLAGHPEGAFEIPTIPSDLQDLKDQLRELDLPAIGMKVQQTLGSVQHVLDTLDSRIGPLADGLQSTLATTTDAVRRLQRDSSRTLAGIDLLAEESRQQVAANGRNLALLLQGAERATDQADTLISSLNDVSSPRGDLQASLRDLAASAGSLRSLTHDLERAPLGTLMRRDK